MHRLSLLASSMGKRAVLLFVEARVSWYMSYLDGALKAEEFVKNFVFFPLERWLSLHLKDVNCLSPRGGIKLFPRLVPDCLMAAEEEGSRLNSLSGLCTH